MINSAGRPDVASAGDVTVLPASDDIGSGAALVGAADSGATVLRQRDWATPPGLKDSTLTPSTATKWSRLHSRRAVIILTAAVAVIVAAAVLVPAQLRHPASTTTTYAVTTASYAFTPQQYPDGLRLARHWALGGRNGSGSRKTISFGRVRFDDSRLVLVVTRSSPGRYPSWMGSGPDTRSFELCGPTVGKANFDAAAPPREPRRRGEWGCPWSPLLFARAWQRLDLVRLRYAL